MSLLSLDLNSTRIRAVSGLAGDFPMSVQLEPPKHDFPMMLSWTGRSFEAGSPGLQICRESPFLICRDFLPHLGEETTFAHRWQLGKHQLDAGQALKLIFQQLRQIATRSRGVTLSLPPYMAAEQIQQIYHLAQESRYPLFGSVSNPLALAIAAFADHDWTGNVAVIDIDDHALWVSVLEEKEGLVELCATRTCTNLNLHHWKSRLLNALADCCIAYSRRDPRESPSAEQSLYLQLDRIMNQCSREETSQVAFETPNWFQQLTLEAGLIRDFCAPLARQVVNQIAPLFNSNPVVTPPNAVLLSHQASLLPGLAPALQQFIDRWAYFNHRDLPQATPPDSDDFGEHLLQEDNETIPRVVLLSADAAARGAHLAAMLFQRGDLVHGHLEESAPLPDPQPLEAGPARLHYQGRDYFLTERPFTLGRRFDCDLAFDADRYAGVDPWHCEILYDPRKYCLKDLSSGGTWLNNQLVVQVVTLSPGDLIRLGDNGPELRFLGHPKNRTVTTTA